MNSVSSPDWRQMKFAEILSYEQPGSYLVSTNQQLEIGKVPVLTAGKTFILGYTNDDHGVYTKHPVIIFDDFTTASKLVDFDFKAKSSAMKILSVRPGIANIHFVYERMQMIEFPLGNHKRHWISEYRQMSIDVPGIAEQDRLAAVISDLTQEIASRRRLIAKKQAIRYGMMQRLLSGRTRLPGYNEPWADAVLGDLAQIVSGGTPRSSVPAYWDGGIAWCTPTDITKESSRYLRATERTISREGLERSAAQLLPKGSLLLCSRATIGEVKIALGPVATNQGFKSLVPNSGVSSEFLYYKMLMQKEELASFGTGSTFLEVSKRDVSGLRFHAPDSKEQGAIATVLTDVDDELDAMQARLSKSKAVKAGIMQDLLTGHTRLPIEEGTL